MKRLFVLLILLLSSVCFSQETVTKEYLTGNFKPSKDKRFVLKAGFYLRQEVWEAFEQMKNEAVQNGLRFRIVSGLRTFNQQKQLWENKWNAKMPVNTDTGEFLPKPNTRQDNLTKENRALRIMEFTAMPSASRHHWGTDFDLNNVNPSYWATAKGQKEYAWLVENAARFGFCQVYSAGRTNGYKEEKWHWSYLPLAKNLTEEYAQQISDFDVVRQNFVGAEAVALLSIINNYVLGINPNCK